MTDHPTPERLVTEMMRLNSFIDATMDDIQSAFERTGRRLSRLNLEEWEGQRNDAVALIYHLQAQNGLAKQVRASTLKSRVDGKADRLLSRIDRLGLSRWPAAAEAAGAVRAVRGA